MYVSTVLVFIYNILITSCVTVNKLRDPPSPKSDTKIELKSLFIPSGLGDIIIIAAPIIDNTTLYYLSRPNSETFQLSIDTKNLTKEYAQAVRINDEYNDINIIYIGGLKEIITPLNRYKIFNVNYGRSCLDPNDTYADNTKNVMPNDFLIGPVEEDDHGNWVLSIYTKNNSKEWVELYQTITIEIIETVPTHPTKPKLNLGETFELSFAYPIEHLESCEVTAPRSTFDRFYERSETNLNSCGFRIRNVTKADEGLWRIIGVGKIVYEATVFLEINTK